MAAWVRVDHSDEWTPDVPEFIGPFPSLMHADQWRARVLPHADVTEDAPEGIQYTVKEAETFLKERF